MNKFPKVTIITCTYNGDYVIEDFLKNLLSQDYSLDKMEILLGDGGSKDKTIGIIKKFEKTYPKQIRYIHNKNQYSEGRGMGKDMLTKMANGEILVILDQDNLLVQKDWLSRSVKILLNNKNIDCVQSRMMSSKNSSLVDKYLNSLGIEDPFASNYSLNAQITLNPKKFPYNKDGDFFVYHGNVNNLLYAGGDGFIIWKKRLFDSGGYTQDTDNSYRMAKNKFNIAVPRTLRFHHKTSTEFFKYFKKRLYFVQHFLLKNMDERDFRWLDFNNNTFSQNMKFFKTVFFNLAFIPGLIQGISKALKDKKAFWLIHPFVLQLLTLGYIYSFFYVKIFKKSGISY